MSDWTDSDTTELFSGIRWTNTLLFQIRDFLKVITGLLFAILLLGGYLLIVGK